MSSRNFKPLQASTQLLPLCYIARCIIMSIELNPTNQASRTGSVGDERAESIRTLAPVDQGPSAWRYLFGAFIIEAVLWGIHVALDRVNTDQCLTLDRRISSYIRRFPGLLLSPTSICRQSKHCRHRNRCHKWLFPRCAVCGASDQAV